MSGNAAPSNANMTPEKMLVAVGRDRDRQAFISLFNHFAPRVKSFLMKGGTGGETAEELVQETFLTVWNRAESYDPRQAAASTWIFTIARNKKIDLLRKEKRFEPDPTDPAFVEDDSLSPAENMAQAQEAGALAKALETLPEEQASLIRMSFFEDKSHGEIAAETKIPLGTVKSRIRLALERLRGAEGVRNLRVL